MNLLAAGTRRFLRACEIACALALCLHPVAAQDRPPWPSGDEIGMANTLGPATWQRCATHLANPNAKSYELSLPALEHHAAIAVRGAAAGKRQADRRHPGHQACFQRRRNRQRRSRPAGHADGRARAFRRAAGAMGRQRRVSVRRCHLLRRLHAERQVKPTPNSPLLKLGIDKVPPIVTTRGAARCQGASRRRQRRCSRASWSPRPTSRRCSRRRDSESRGLVAGDVLYIYTGWGDHWKDPDTEKFYYTKGPGLSYDAAKLIEQKTVVLVALDNPFTDPVAEGFLQGNAPPAAGTPRRPAVRDPPSQSDGGGHPQYPECQSWRDGQRQGLAVLHDHPSAAHARRLGLAGAAGRDRRAGEVDRDAVTSLRCKTS